MSLHVISTSFDSGRLGLDIDQRIEEYVGASQGPSAKLDKPFILDIEIDSTEENSYYH